MSRLIEGITQNQLMNCYYLAARIVSLYGDAYLPVFKRLHDEVEKSKQASDIKSLAMMITSCYDSQRSEQN